MEVTLKLSILSLKCYVNNNRHHLIIVAVIQIHDEKRDIVTEILVKTKNAIFI